ncbi:MAG TPA: amidohydrolase family protein [Vulgatibacter sp.]|nr:amidohydrolase family protein [Vulgatibacter sp.]
MPLRAPHRLLLALPLALAACAAAHRPVLVTPPDTHHEAPPTLITNVRVFTGLEDELTQPVDVLLSGGRIAKVSHPGRLEAPAGAEVVDGEGRTLIPGLVDMNVRLGTFEDVPPWAGAIVEPRLQAEALIYSGITTAVAVGHDADVEALQREIAKGWVAGPRIFRSTHPIAGKEASRPGPFERWLRTKVVKNTDTPRDAARAARRDLESLRSDFVKVEFGGGPGLSRKALEAVVAEARMYERSVFVDARGPQDAAEAAEAGASLLLHTPWMGTFTPEQMDAIAMSGAPVVTTARIWAAMGERMSGAAVHSDLEREIVPPDEGADVENTVSADTRELASTYDAALRANLVALHRNGIPLLAGTGAGLPGVIHGASLHQELQALVELGLPPAEVLKMATSYPVRLIAPRSPFGMIGIGAYADVILLDGDPLRDISAVGRIVAVWQAGRKLERRVPGPAAD